MDLSLATASELTAALAGASLSSRELLDHVIGRIETIDPALNAVVTTDYEQAARASAAADDAVARGEDLGPLHGLVMTVKDVWETRGMRTTSGAPQLRDHVPGADAVAVARLRDAGAVIVGKTNTPLFAADYQTFNDVFGRSNNPWDLERSPGGSSGGAAAALAAGIVALELGSDLGGSIRIPSHCCGTYGLKPTWGVVPLRGHIPGPPGSLVEADVNSGGPMARSVGDLRLALEVLAGPLPEDAAAWRLSLPDDLDLRELRQLRLGVTIDDASFPVGSEVRAALRGIVDAVADAGARVVESPPPVPMADAVDTWNDLVLPMIGLGLPDATFDEFAAAPIVADDRQSVAGARLTARFRDRARAHQRRQLQRRRWAQRFDEFDAWLMPTMQVPAHEHDPRPVREREVRVDDTAISALDLVAWPGAVGAMLLPAVTIPAGLSTDGLPIGVQIVGPHLGDLRLLRISALIDAVGPGFRPPPGY